MSQHMHPHTYTMESVLRAQTCVVIAWYTNFDSGSAMFARLCFLFSWQLSYCLVEHSYVFENGRGSALCFDGL